MEEIHTTYVGGSLDGKKARPSLVRTSLRSNIPIMHTTRVFDDYWMYIFEYYQCKKKNNKFNKISRRQRMDLVVLKLNIIY